LFAIVDYEDAKESSPANWHVVDVDCMIENPFSTPEQTTGHPVA
jgi:hypothetical protein